MSSIILMDSACQTENNKKRYNYPEATKKYRDKIRANNGGKLYLPANKEYMRRYRAKLKAQKEEQKRSQEQQDLK